MRKPIIEHFIAEAKITETDKSKLRDGVLCSVRYPICQVDGINRNNRKYEKAVFELVQKDPEFIEKMAHRAMLMQEEHPATGNQTKTGNVVGVVTGIEIDEKSNTVYADMEVINTRMGQDVYALLIAECGIGTSTRAEGELEEVIESGGEGKSYMRVVPEAYKFLTIDFTADPSTYGAYPMNVQRNVSDKIRAGVGEGRISRQTGKAILEAMSAPEAKEVKDRIDKCDGKCDTGCQRILTGKCACSETSSDPKSPNDPDGVCSRCGKKGETWWHVCRACHEEADRKYREEAEKSSKGGVHEDTAVLDQEKKIIDNAAQILLPKELYDRHEWTGDELILYKGDQEIERYSKEALKQAGVLESVRKLRKALKEDVSINALRKELAAKSDDELQKLYKTYLWQREEGSISAYDVTQFDLVGQELDKRGFDLDLIEADESVRESAYGIYDHKKGTSGDYLNKENNTPITFGSPGEARKYIVDVLFKDNGPEKHRYEISKLMEAADKKSLGGALQSVADKHKKKRADSFKKYAAKSAATHAAKGALGEDISTDKVKAVVQGIKAIADTIQELGEVPSGELYAQLLQHITLDQYNQVIDILKGAGVISVNNHLIKWIGPQKTREAAKEVKCRYCGHPSEDGSGVCDKCYRTYENKPVKKANEVKVNEIENPYAKAEPQNDAFFDQVGEKLGALKDFTYLDVGLVMKNVNVELHGEPDYEPSADEINNIIDTLIKDGTPPLKQLPNGRYTWANESKPKLGESKQMTAEIIPYNYFGWEGPEGKVWVVKDQMHPDPLKKMIWGRSAEDPEIVVSDFKGHFEKAGAPVSITYTTQGLTASAEQKDKIEAIKAWIKSVGESVDDIRKEMNRVGAKIRYITDTGTGKEQLPALEAQYTKLSKQLGGSMTEAFFPPAVNPASVGSYSMLSKSGGGYVYDDVLEYRVWLGDGGDDAMQTYPTYAEAKKVYDEATVAGKHPDLVVLVRQDEYIDEPTKGVFVRKRGPRVTEWLPEWLEGSKRTEELMQSILKDRKGNEAYKGGAATIATEEQIKVWAAAYDKAVSEGKSPLDADIAGVKALYGRFKGIEAEIPLPEARKGHSKIYRKKKKNIRENAEHWYEVTVAADVLSDVMEKQLIAAGFEVAGTGLGSVEFIHSTEKNPGKLRKMIKDAVGANADNFEVVRIDADPREARVQHTELDDMIKKFREVELIGEKTEAKEAAGMIVKAVNEARKELALVKAERDNLTESKADPKAVREQAVRETMEASKKLFISKMDEMKKTHEKAIADIKETHMLEMFQRTVVDKKIAASGLNLPKESVALLRKARTDEEVDRLIGECRMALRESLLHSGKPTDATVTKDAPNGSGDDGAARTKKLLDMLR